MRKPRRIAVLALAGLGLFGVVGLDTVPAAHAVQIAGQPPDEGCGPVPGAPKNYCPPPPDEPCPTGRPSEKCPGEEPCPTGKTSEKCPGEEPCVDIRRCPPPAECENTCPTTTTTTIAKKTPPGVLWNPSYTG